eukprot:5333849-Pyramimonas_sp.AAC.1
MRSKLGEAEAEEEGARTRRIQRQPGPPGRRSCRAYSPRQRQQPAPGHQRFLSLLVIQRRL